MELNQDADFFLGVICYPCSAEVSAERFFGCRHKMHCCSFLLLIVFSVCVLQLSIPVQS